MVQLEVAAVHVHAGPKIAAHQACTMDEHSCCQPYVIIAYGGAFNTVSTLLTPEIGASAGLLAIRAGGFLPCVTLALACCHPGTPWCT